MNFKILLLVPAAVLLANFTNGQGNWCGTDAYNENLLNGLTQEELSQYLKERDQLFQFAHNQADQSGTVYTIPVVVHVIHDNCIGNISKEQVEDGIRILNEDYRRTNSDTGSTRTIFKPHTDDAEIEFKLAKIDPNGNCTEGIVRVNSTLTYNVPVSNSASVKSLSYWPSNRYLNVWLVESIGTSSGGLTTLGFAQFPGNSWGTYGTVIRNDRWGTIGSSHDDGRVATHEIGHCLGLSHTFQGGCGGNCSTSGDKVCDTPPSYEATFGCSSTQNTCSNDASGSQSPYSTNVVDQIENYMSYDACTNMFSKGQISVMRGSLTSYSNLINLVSPNNLIITGTNSGHVPTLCPPTADFCKEKVDICEGASVNFADRSYNGKISGRTWSFPGGNPASSSDSSVTVTYPTKGNYNVTLNVSNSSGNTNKTLTGLVSVYSSSSDFVSWKYGESFEDETHFNKYWTISSGFGVKWEITTAAAYTGDKSAILRNFYNFNSGEIDELISPSYDLSAIIEPELVFKVAYARKSASTEDVLHILYSTNCGNSWSVIGIKNAIVLESVTGFVSSNFVPSGSSEWKELEISISSFLAKQKNVKFKFEFISDLGNNIYLDDINVQSATGIEENEFGRKIRVFPNPVSEYLNIVAEGDAGVNQMTVFDITGQAIYVQNYAGRGSETGNTFRIDVSSFHSGVYFVKILGIRGELVVKKFTVK